MNRLGLVLVLAIFLVAHGAVGAGEIHEAVKAQKLVKLAEIVAKDAGQVNALDQEGWSPLGLAVLAEDLKTTKFLLAKKADVNIKDADGFAPLHWAVIKGNKKVIGLLIKYNADVNVTEKDGITPLITAVGENQLDVVKYLLSKGAAINHVITNGELKGQTALKLAEKGKLTAIVSFLKSQGAR